MVRPQLSESKAAARLEQTLQPNMSYENGDNSSSERIDGIINQAIWQRFYFSNNLLELRLKLLIFVLKDFSNFYILIFKLCTNICAFLLLNLDYLYRFERAAYIFVTF